MQEKDMIAIQALGSSLGTGGDNSGKGDNASSPRTLMSITTRLLICSMEKSASRILLDTQNILFMLSEPERPTKNAHELIANFENNTFFSLLSIWKVAIKHNIHPKNMPVSALQVVACRKKTSYDEAPLVVTMTCILERLSDPTTITCIKIRVV